MSSPCSRATEVDLSAMEDAQCDAVKLLPTEASTHHCVEFPLPKSEDTDESSTMADMKVDEEKEVVDNLHSDYPPCDADSCATEKQIADVSAESRDFSERATEQFNSCVTGEKKGGEGDEGEERKVDKEIEDTRERKESRSETVVDTEMVLEIKESDESIGEEPTEGGGEEIADKKHEEKMEEQGGEQDNALCRGSCKIWDELEDVICEVIDDEESKQTERKDVKEGVDGEGHVVEDVEQIAIVSGEKTVEVMEEVMNKTEDKIEVVEEPRETTKDKHKDAETQQEFEGKKTNLPKRSELEKAIQEKHAVNEETQDHDREEVEQKENNVKDKADKQLTLPPSVDEKDKRRREVKSDIKEAKEGWKCEDSQGGVGRKLVISKHPPVKVYQVKAVPIVPPKPQHCKITALTLRQQQQQRDRRDNAYTMKVPTEGEQGKDGDTEEEGRGKKELPGLRGGEKERERRRDGDEGATRDTTRNSPLSMCFDEAVAIATMRREKEKECEKEKERQRDWGSEVQ